MADEPERFEIPAWVLERVRQEKLPKRFTGRIEVNCFEGGVSNVNILRSFKAPNHDTTRVTP